MSFISSGFVQSPSELALELCSKEQLLEIAEHYQIAIGDLKKKKLKDVVKEGLMDLGVLCDQPRAGASFQSNPTTLTFEQQRELLQMQLDLERLKSASRPVAGGGLQFDVAHLIVGAFNRWCTAAEVVTLQVLSL